MGGGGRAMFAELRGDLVDGLAFAGSVLLWWTLLSVCTAVLWSLAIGLAKRASGRQGHFATGGSDISTASGLCPVSSPNFVPRS
jgi:hypothetical protein